MSFIKAIIYLTVQSSSVCHIAFFPPSFLLEIRSILSKSILPEQALGNHGNQAGGAWLRSARLHRVMWLWLVCGVTKLYSAEMAGTHGVVVSTQSQDLLNLENVWRCYFIIPDRPLCNFALLYTQHLLHVCPSWTRDRSLVRFLAFPHFLEVFRIWKEGLRTLYRL